MKKITYIGRLAVTSGFLLVLVGCANLRDVDHRWCSEEEVVAHHEVISLQADALFAFDGGTMDDMQLEGKKQLDNLAISLPEAYASIEHIVIEGHTDRLGAVQYNQRLSQVRAETVKSYLQQKGVNAPMTAVGYGASNPVSTGCIGTRATDELIKCLQVDRRVNVEVKGIKKE
ncbi:hypothetical protein HMPREF3144_02440 [Oligella sp. HMSC05A10]|uniref:OmpA family protein n=1 Tax=Oligella sp. HMSC05A10 TaxID=1581112 RepID=UPI0008C510CB|nr:OmpA family protein [Oligella sp. HMSC05A10]OFS88294.1 hypothetical protein HMPREF3144_02440 [Oligella sp. HMSC05A10]